MPLMVEARRHASAKPDSSLTGIISITIGVRRAFRNVMKPWFQCGRIQLVVATVS